MAPQILGVFPAVSRQVLRVDVRESEVVAVRHVHMPSLFSGRLGFDDKVAQGYDDKELDSGKVPAQALAAARCVVKFTDAWRDTPAFDLKPYQQDGFIVSSTKQLRWQESGENQAGGFFTLNTDGTKAVVGFASGQACPLGDVTIAPQSRFAAIYVTAPEKDGQVATSQRLLLVAMARARNTGMKFSPAGNELLEKGAGPMLMEPVKATFAIRGRALQQVNLLDHDGVRTGQTLPVTNGQFVIDGAADKTPYYELVLNRP